MYKFLNTYKFLKKNIWAIFIVCILVGFIFQYLQSKQIPQRKYYNVEHIETGEKETFEYLEYEPKFSFLSVLSTIFIGAGISLLILIAIDKRIDEKEKKENRQIQDSERKDFEDRIVELNNRILNDVFEGTLKRIIPEELFDLLKAQVFLSDYVRKNAKWIYEVREDCNKNICVKQTTMYELHNVTERQTSKEFNVVVTSTEKKKIEIESIKVNNKLIEITKNSITEGIKTETYKYKVDLEKGEKENISITINNEYYEDSIRDLQTTKYPIINLEVQLINHSSLKVNLNGSFAGPLIAKNETQGDLIIYEPIKAVLPGQGILYTIEKNAT